MWSFVGNKGNKQWIGLALDRDTREIVGVLSVTRIFGQRMLRFSPTNATMLLARRQVIPALLSV
jgi:IS1 family transposase